MKRILITGASGFIGSFFVEKALKLGYEIYAAIRETSDLSYLQDSRIIFFKANLSKKESIKEHIEKIGRFDYIIHNAGLTKTCKKEMFDFVNYQITKNIIEVLTETNKIPDKFILISSLAAYGPGNSDTLKPIKISDEQKPVSFYGKSKLKTEKYLKSLNDFPYLIFRPTGVYGPREKDYFVMYKSIKKGIETYIGTKEQHITFIYVKDLVDVIFDAIKSDIINKSYFVTDLKSYTTKEFNNIVKKELNKKTISIVMPTIIVKVIAFLSEKISCFLTKNVPTLNVEKFKEISEKNWLCDSTSLVNDFNYKPKYDLSKGLHETINWLKNKKLI